MKLVSSLVLGALALGAAACGDESVTTAALADFSIEIDFYRQTDTWTGTIEPDTQAELAGVKGQIACAWLDTDGSSLSVQYAGPDSGDFELKATLIDGSEQLPFFTWKAKLSNGTPKALLPGAGLDTATAKRLGDILKRPDNRFSVRYDFTTDAAATEKVTFINVLKLRVATPQGTCPAQ